MNGDWAFWALLSALFAAATAILAKLGARAIDPDVATLVRTVVVLLCLVGVVSFTRQWPALATLNRRALLFLTLSGVATGASWLCYFRALQIGEVAKVAPVDKLSVLFVALFAVLFLGERLTPREWTGIGLVAAGVVLIAIKR